MKLTIVYITARDEPEIGWCLDSLRPQMNRPVRFLPISYKMVGQPGMKAFPPKPNVWHGPHRLTKADWWAASNARNTGICLCKTEWIAFLDDRCVLAPTWMAAIDDAIKGNYCVCGPYQKRHGMTVENGVIKHGGIIDGDDNRLAIVKQHWGKLSNPYAAPPEWTYGCTIALPLEWALAVNGFEELCDGMRYEDVFFGMMLANSGFPIKYDTRFGVVQDRTPGKCGPMLRGGDKGESPNDKSHKILEMVRSAKRTLHQWDLRQVRADVLAGKPFPIPTGPTTDWYDGQPLSEMV